MNKLAKIIRELEPDELRLVKRDLEEGHITKLIADRMRELQEQNENAICPVCHSSITEESMTLTFGPQGFRKKARFCATDCLEYFLKRMHEKQTHRKIKKEDLHEQRA